MNITEKAITLIETLIETLEDVSVELNSSFEYNKADEIDEIANVLKTKIKVWRINFLKTVPENGLTFYEKVLEEIEFGFGDLRKSELNLRPYLCEYSTIFNEAWSSSKRTKIIEHANLFIDNKELLRVESGTDGLQSLFFINFPEVHNERLITRLDFLEWCIKENLDICPIQM